MHKHFAGTATALLIAFVILAVSMVKCATPRFAFYPNVLPESVDSSEVNVEYQMPYPGKISPDTPFWYIKALRDRARYWLTFKPTSKARLLLLFSDKRMMHARDLFVKTKPDLGYNTLTRSDNYLLQAYQKGQGDAEAMKQIALASLKHREIIEEEIIPIAPEDAKPLLIKSIDSSVLMYNNSKKSLITLGITPPENPFDKE